MWLSIESSYPWRNWHSQSRRSAHTRKTALFRSSRKATRSIPSRAPISTFYTLKQSWWNALTDKQTIARVSDAKNRSRRESMPRKCSRRKFAPWTFFDLISLYPVFWHDFRVGPFYQENTVSPTIVILGFCKLPIYVEGCVGRKNEKWRLELNSHLLDISSTNMHFRKSVELAIVVFCLFSRRVDYVFSRTHSGGTLVRGFVFS